MIWGRVFMCERGGEKKGGSLGGERCTRTGWTGRGWMAVDQALLVVVVKCYIYWV